MNPKKVKNWYHYQISSDYSVSYKQIGSRIILLSPVGLSKIENIQSLFECRENFLKKVGLYNTYYSEIRNFKNVTRYLRKGNIEYLKLYNQECAKGKLISLYNCHISSGLHWILQLVTLLIRRNPKQEFVEKYGDAEKSAVIDLYKKGIFSLENKSIIAKKEILFEGEKNSFRISMMTNQIIYCEIQGHFSRENMHQIFLSIRRILQKNTFREGFFLVFKWREGSDIPVTSIKEMPKRLSFLEKEASCLGLFFVKNKGIINKTIQNIIFQFSIISRVCFNIQEALHETYSDKLNLNSLMRESSEMTFASPGRQELNSDIEDLLLFINATEYHPEQIDDINETISETHYLKLLYNSLAAHSKNRYEKKIEQEERLKQLNFSNTINILKYKTLNICIDPELDPQHKMDQIFRCSVPLLEATGVYFFEKIETEYYCRYIWPQGAQENENWKLDSSLVKLLDKQNYISGKDKNLINREQEPFFLSLFSRMSAEYLIPIHYQFSDKKNIFVVFSFPEKTWILPVARTIRRACREMIEKWDTIYSGSEPSASNNDTERIDLPPPVNMEEAVYEFDSSEDFYLTIVREFIKNFPGQLEFIQESIRQNEMKKAARESHKLKGGAANLFAMELSRAAAGLEESLKNNNHEEAENAIINLQKKWFHFADFFKNQYDL